MYTSNDFSIKFDGKIFYEHSIIIDQDYYGIHNLYKLDEFQLRLTDSRISYCEVLFENSESKVFDSLKIKSDSLVCYSTRNIEKYFIKDIKEIELFRLSTDREKQGGLYPFVGGALIGLLSDLNNKKDSPTYTRTIIGSAIGLGLGLLIYFDNHQFYEKIYVNK